MRATCLFRRHDAVLDVEVEAVLGLVAGEAAAVSKLQARAQTADPYQAAPLKTLGGRLDKKVMERVDLNASKVAAVMKTRWKDLSDIINA